ncbi:hypothetical protein [Sphingomonas qomolangmaensis]|uniref:Uncharacterized protein n=1 Tax=Sphingomonas qomolangmaensis TaxID=2918765 RepID=A0ABY5L690_9SPHN|nr:hypothetical protein [Sphingomonas qomolangmaensis]UUL81422.1 hypothetical protein NMP03_09360 [Sphingomonas qomolangmaensis]
MARQLGADRALFSMSNSEVYEVSLKTILIATRVFAFLTLLFVPAFAVLILVAFVSGQALWFAIFGLPALLLNACIVLAKPQRDRIWRWANSVAGTKARL